MTEKTLDIFTADGFRLKAILYIPKRVRKVVLMCHGISSHKQEYLDMFPRLADLLRQQDIGSIRFDYRGHGESSGSSIDFSVVSQLIDVETVVHWLGQQDGLENLPLSYVGVSFGGAPGLFYQKLHKSFQEISLFAPVLSYWSTFVEPKTDWGKANFCEDAWREAKSKGFLLLDGEFKIGLRLLNELLLLDPLNVIGQLDIPIQIFHGSQDTLVPYSVAEVVANDYPKIDVRLIPEMGHGLYVGGDADGVTQESRAIQEYYFRTTVEFLS